MRGTDGPAAGGLVPAGVTSSGEAAVAWRQAGNWLNTRAKNG